MTRVAVAEGRAVRSGDLLGETRQPALETEVAKLGWRVDELQAEADSELAGDRVKRQISQFAIAETEKQLPVQRLRSAQPRLAARTPGRLVLVQAPASHLPGRPAKSGHLLRVVAPDLNRACARSAPSVDTDTNRP